LLPTESPGQHYQGDVRDLLDYPWDLMIAHPPCTDLCVSGARHFPAKKLDARQQASVSFFMALAKAGIPHIAIENPVGIISSLWRKPDQVIQPWQFGHGETKATCLWLKNLPPLTPTSIVEGRDGRVWKLPPTKDRWKLRSETYQGIADAMAAQWMLWVSKRSTDK
jgi:site-specific DNA-cytosine methylase